MARCVGCGKFCNQTSFDGASSLCTGCSTAWHAELSAYSRPDSQWMGPPVTDPDSRYPLPMVTAAPPSPQQSSYGRDSALGASEPDGQTLDETSRSQHGGQRGVEEQEEHREDDQNQENGLCARCWVAAGTSILYNSPVCGDCLRQAQEKREPIKGTKKRYQPPTPALQPGKRLTRVCDTCRRKRKRCQHRRIVDENHSDADPRPRRNRRQEARGPAGSGVPTPPDSATEQAAQAGVSPRRVPSRVSPRRASTRQAHKRVEPLSVSVSVPVSVPMPMPMPVPVPVPVPEPCLSPPSSLSSLSSLLEVVNNELEKTGPPAHSDWGQPHNHLQARHGPSPAGPPPAMPPEPEIEVDPGTGDMRLVVKDSAAAAHARELARAVAEMQDRLAGMQAVVQGLKARVDLWADLSCHTACA
ncbi:hypothetical protein KEM52_002462 [Ascosphaera acerosa]|nr:hypothetical protein KEM52_002462 [Ascosphaera acerosa]